LVEQLDLVGHGDSIAKEAFGILLSEAAALPTATLAERLGADQRLVEQVLHDLSRVGRAEMDGGRLLGIYGLTLRPTQHCLKLRGSTFFTWCAFDLVGIPAALGESAEVSSECAQCHRVVSFAVTDGEPPDLPIVISWLSERCDSIRDQFCPTVNFYCDQAHYEAAVGAGQAPDASLSLDRAAAMGRENWGWAR
jgi:alkylmercury lyase